MRTFWRLLALLLFSSLLIFAGIKDNPQVVIKTELGEITVEIYEQAAPITASNFLKYVDENLFQNSCFYRVVRMDNQPNDKIKIEVVQGGLFFTNPDNMLAPIEHETTKKTGVLHKDGVISMGRLDPGTATSEFFICVGDQPELDFGGRRNPDGQGFSAFGKVVAGMDVIRKIHQQPTEGQMLVSRVKIFNIVRINSDSNSMFVFPSGDQGKAHIEVIAPNGGEVWAEGETHEIRWKAEGVDEVQIAVAVGGKDKGHLGTGSPIHAQQGKFAWTIPQGFVTGFGVSKASNVRVMIYDARHREIYDISDGSFTIVGARPSSTEERVVPAIQDDKEYRDAIVHYYEALSGQQYRLAYDMLSRCKIVLTNADGSAVAFQPRQDFQVWLEAQKNIQDVKIKEVKRLIPLRNPEQHTADKGNALAILGIRSYKVTLEIKLHQENWTVRSGENTFFISVVKGTDGKIRILEIGTGP